MTAIGVIPARHASTRFPGKPLVRLGAKPMVQWVWERVRRAESLDEVLVATDDERIRQAVLAFGGNVVMTSPEHPTGTDRVAEAVADSEAEIVVNVQGDEPLVDPASIDALVGSLRADDGADLATLAVPLSDRDGYLDPAVVKVVTDARGRALYFSRAPIPWPRDGEPPPPGALRHVGLYAFRRPYLEEFCEQAPSRLERIEMLEQLRALEHGARIAVVVGAHESLAVDTPADVAAVEARLRSLERMGSTTEPNHEAAADPAGERS